MFKRYQIAAFALGLILFSPLGQAQDQASNTNGETGAHQRPSHQSSFSVPVNIIEDKATTDARDRHEAEARQREIEDLVAQQGMNSATQEINSATQAMAAYAYWSTILVGVGTALLFVTLYLTYQANRAAQAAIAVTRDIGQAQTRAYVGISDYELRFDTDTIDKKTHISRCTLFLKWKNAGNSPAFNFRAKTDHVFIKHDSIGEHIDQFDLLSIEGKPSELILSGDFVGDNIEMGAILFESWRRKDFILVVHSFVVYEDIFSTVFEIKSCQSFEIRSEGENPTEGVLWMESYHHHNSYKEYKKK